MKIEEAECETFYEVEATLQEFIRRTEPNTTTEDMALEWMKELAGQVDPKWKRAFCSMAGAEWCKYTGGKEAKLIDIYVDGLSRLTHAPFGDVQIDRLLGDGGYGWVFRATQRARSVAVKIPKLDCSQDERGRRADFNRLLQEIDIQISLRHGNIVLIHECCHLSDGRCAVVMELADTSLEKCHTLPLDDRVAALRDIADALAYCHTPDGLAHLKPVVHADVKAANILRFRVNDHKLIWKLSDFGMAVRSWDVSPGGTLAYMSPEQVMRLTIGPASDIWSLGVVLYWACTKQVPFDGKDSGQLGENIKRGKFDPARTHYPEMPTVLEEIIHDCLTKNEQKRPTANEVVRRLNSYIESTVTGGPIFLTGDDHGAGLGPERPGRPVPNDATISEKPSPAHPPSPTHPPSLADLASGNSTGEPCDIKLADSQLKAAFLLGVNLWELCFELPPFSSLSNIRDRLTAHVKELAFPLDCSDVRPLAGRIDRLHVVESNLFKLWQETRVTQRLKACVQLGRRLMQTFHGWEILMDSGRVEETRAKLGTICAASFIPRHFVDAYIDSRAQCETPNDEAWNKANDNLMQVLSTYDASISWSHADRDVADRIRFSLEDHALRADMNLPNARQANTSLAMQSRAVIVLYSKHFLADQDAVQTLTHAVSPRVGDRIPLLLVSLDGTPVTPELSDAASIIPAYQGSEYLTRVFDEVRRCLV